MSLIEQFTAIAIDDPEIERIPSHARFLSAPIQSLETQAAPIEPSWILSGSPQARAKLHSDSADGFASTTLWECTAGAFRWHFVWDETVVILDGSVTVTDETGRVTRLEQGDVAFFAAGSWATWEIDDHVRKIAFCRRAFPAPVVFALKLKSMLKAFLRGGAPKAGAGLAVVAEVAVRAPI